MIGPPGHMPRVSVVIPCYNGRQYLETCLRSITPVLSESCEAIVVDDGSTEPIVDIVESFAPRVRYVRQNNQGPARARNLGIAQTSGQYISFLDSDDCLLAPDVWREQLALLESNASVGLVYAKSCVIDAAGRVIGVRKCPHARESYIHPGHEELPHLIRRNYITTSTTIVRREVFEEVGPFRDELTTGEDWVQWLGIARLSAIAYVAKPVAAYRRHESSVTARHAALRWRELHYGILSELFADADFAKDFGSLHNIAFAAQDLGAARSAYSAGQMALARRWAWQSLRKHAEAQDVRTAATCLSLIVRTFAPKSVRATYRKLKFRRRPLVRSSSI